MKLDSLRHLTSEDLGRELKRSSTDPLLDRLEELGLPDKKSEAYRYFDPELLLSPTYQVLDYVPQTIQEGEKLEIVNGTVITAPKDLRVYYASSANVDMEHYDPLYYLGHLLSSQVIIVEIDGDRDVELLHRFTKSETLIHYRIVIKNQAYRHATLYESFESENAEGSLVLYGYDIDIAHESTLRIVKNHTINDEAYHLIASHNISVGRKANMMLKSFDFGNTSALQLFKVVLEDHAHVEAGHLHYISGKAKRGTISQIIHKGEHSSSAQESKSILENGSRGIFDALIRVEHAAKYTKAHQNSKAVLLGESSYMIAKPQLEIYIDELEASHGATTGQLDEKQLFYLQSRGISEDEAKKILIIAFANTLIEKVKDTRYQELISHCFENAFYSHTST